MLAESTKVDNLLRAQIPPWDDLFGAQSQCACNECESITGALHYLVAILYFSEHCNVNQDTPPRSPYDVLVSRAPHLPHIPLTCENLNDPVPYIVTVLDELDFYVAKGVTTGDANGMTGFPAYNSTTDDWKAGYIATAAQAYKTLSSQCYPFDLPYNLPLDIIRTYLRKLNIKRYELISTFDIQNSNREDRLFKEFFSLSDEEYTLLTQFQIGGSTLDVPGLFGFPDRSSFEKDVYSVPVLLNRAGLRYTELIDVLKTRFVNPGGDAADFIDALFGAGNTDRVVLFGTLKEIRNSSYNQVLQSRIQSILSKSAKPALDPLKFKNWIDGNFDAFQNSVVLIPDPNDPCNFETATLSSVVSLVGQQAGPNIDDDSWKRFYLFIRLMRKTGLSIPDLDNLLFPLSGLTNTEVVSSLCYAMRVMQKFGLTAGQVTPLLGAIDTRSAGSVYARVFLNPVLNNVNSEFFPDEFGNYFVSGPTVASKLDVILSATGLKKTDVDSISGFDTTNTNLSINVLGAFYGLAELAESLGITLGNLTSLAAVSGKPGALFAWDKQSKTFSAPKLSDLWSFLEFIDIVDGSGFSSEELMFVLGAATSTPAFVSNQLSDDNIRSSLIALRAGLDALNAQYPDPASSPIVTMDTLQNQLLLTYDRDAVEQLVGMLNGNIIYGTTLASRPDIRIPGPLTSRIAYSGDTGRLEVRGVVTAADWNIVQTDSTLKVFLQPIYDKPFEFLRNNFGGFITSDNDRNALLDRASTVVQDKVRLLYDWYQPYFTKPLQANLVLDQAAALLSLERSTLSVIMKHQSDSLVDIALAVAGEIAPDATTLPQPGASDLRNKLVTLYKVSLFVARFALSADEVSKFIDSSATFSDIDFSTFTLEQWLRLNDYVGLRKSRKSATLTLFDIFGESSSASLPVLEADVCLLMGWKPDDLAGLVGEYGYGPSDFKDEKALVALNRMMIATNRSGLPAAQLAKWGTREDDYSTLDLLAGEVKNATLQRFEERVRDDTRNSIDAVIWEHQRNALVSCILNMQTIKNAGIRNVEELCGHFLIDLPMGSCMPTTRVRQAISIVQSFMKRCIMGLESVKKVVGNQTIEVGVSPDQIDVSLWEPKSLFRTWQVTMEFLTNPYPYLSYKYITEKSEAAKRAEETLLKSDTTERTVEDVYRAYLQDVRETANPEVVTMFIDDIDTDNIAGTVVIHVIGKTREMPHTYYYRKKDESDQWTFWEKIPVAIKENDADGNGKSGAPIIFLKFKHLYYLLLPEFVRRKGDDSATDSVTFNATEGISAGNIRSLRTPVYWELKIGISEYFGGKWTPKKYLKIEGDNLGTVFATLNVPDISNYFVRAQVVKDNGADDHILLTLMPSVGGGAGRGGGKVQYPQFSIKSVNSAVTADFQQYDPADIDPNFQCVRLPSSQLQVVEDGVPLQVLGNANGGSICSSPSVVDFQSIIRQPFFFQDSNRSYYVSQAPISYTIKEVHQETVVGFPLQEIPTAAVSVLQKPASHVFLAHSNFTVKG